MRGGGGERGNFIPRLNCSTAGVCIIIYRDDLSTWKFQNYESFIGESIGKHSAEYVMSPEDSTEFGKYSIKSAYSDLRIGRSETPISKVPIEGCSGTVGSLD